MKTQKILHYIWVISAILYWMLISWLVYAITWPSTPAWEFLYWWFVSYFEKALVMTWSDTDWVVKKVVDTDNLWTWTIISTASWLIWLWTNNPQARFDINWKVKIPNLQLNSITQSWYMIVWDIIWNARWSYNNYRLEVASLMRNMWNYWTSCFAMEDWTVKCVWYHQNWEMWIWSNLTNYYLPKDVPISWVKKLVSANLDILALMNDGSIYALGWYNSFWELWLWWATLINVPYKVPWINNAVDVVISWSWNWSSWIAHSCALLSSWWVKCWWYNWYWQLWDWSTTTRYSPVNVLWVINAIKIMITQWEHPWASCALISDWTIKCWWWNGQGNLWVWDATDRVTATNVVWINNAVDFDLGWSYGQWIHACAVLSDKTVKCWWYNGHWETWNGWTANVSTPVSIWLSNIEKVVISWWSWYSTYAITTDWQVYSWWYNAWGNLWVWDATVRYSPTLIPWLTWAMDIKSTWWWSVSTCALISDWTVKCWWYNAQWQLWVWDTSNRYSPTSVMLTEKVKDIEIYDTYYSTRPWTCALMYNGSVMCWWWNWYGQLWQNNTNNYNIPITVKNLNKN